MLHSPLELNDGKGGLGSGDKSHEAFKANAGRDRHCPKAGMEEMSLSAKQLLIVPVEPDFQNPEASVDFGGRSSAVRLRQVCSNMPGMSTPALRCPLCERTGVPGQRRVRTQGLGQP